MTDAFSSTSVNRGATNGRGSATVRRLLRSPTATVALSLLAIFLASAVFAPWIAQHSPYDLARLDLLDSHLPPAFMKEGDPRFLLGTDSQGADLLSLVLYGMRTSLLVGALSVILSVGLGATAGLVSGYFGGRLDSFIMRIADIQFTFPAILLALLINGICQSLMSGATRETFSLPMVVIALGISHWPHFARLVRGAVLVEKQKDYVASARLAGRGSVFIMTQQILPNVLNSVLVLGTLDFVFAITSEATLSYLGFGMPATQPSLGTLIRLGYSYLFSGEWWLVATPGLFLMLLLASINIFGDWLRDVLDPELKQ